MILYNVIIGYLIFKIKSKFHWLNWLVINNHIVFKHTNLKFKMDENGWRPKVGREDEWCLVLWVRHNSGGKIRCGRELYNCVCHHTHILHYYHIELTILCSWDNYYACFCHTHLIQFHYFSIHVVVLYCFVNCTFNWLIMNWDCQNYCPGTSGLGRYARYALSIKSKDIKVALTSLCLRDVCVFVGIVR